VIANAVSVSLTIGDFTMANDLRLFLTKESYVSAVMTELTQTELALLNFTIYYNPKHAEYYRMFACGEYKACWEYLMENRGDMTMDNVPEKWRSQAEHSLKSVMAMNLGKKDD